MRTDDPRRWARWLDVVDLDVRGRLADLREFVASGVPRVWAHTVTTRAQRDRAVRLGVDGIVTDDPRYLSGVTDDYPVSPTVIDLQDKPAPVQVSDRTTARVAVSSQSGPVIPGAVVTVGGREVTGRMVRHPRSGVSTARVWASAADKGIATVRFRVAADRGKERRWGAAKVAVPLEVTGEDLELVPSVRTTGTRLEVSVDLLDSAARAYEGPGRERGTGIRSVAGLGQAGLRLQVLRHGVVVHRQRLAGADTGTPGNGAGTVAFSPWEAPRGGRYTVRLSQRGPVYRHVVLERRVRLR
jgi:hypothetical protein